jgi:ElaB/YqjD/DUF883 family membrane-anchored ribosome-binding protein
MPKYTTLTDYVNTQIEKYDIPDTEKNRSKLRIKFTRELKRLRYWDTAEKKVIGRNETRLFTDEQLNQLSIEVEPYLLKQGNVNTEELEEYRQNFENYVEDIHNQTNESHQQQLEAEQYEAPRVTKREAMEVMLTALFQKFFEPLDVQKWNQDKETIHFAELTDMTNTDYILASMRLNNPVQSYTKEK